MNLRTSSAVLLLTAVMLTGCAGGGAPTDPGTSGPPDDEGVAYARAQVEAHLVPSDEGFVPTEPVPDVASLQGKHVVYIPILAQVPIFAISYEGFKAAFAEVGIETVLCDGAANPSAVASCFDQAVNTNAAGVVLESTPPQMALEAYNSVVAAGIPVLITGATPPPDSPATVQPGGVDVSSMMRLAIDYIIAESEGSATILGGEINDSETTIAWMDDAAAELAERCPACTMDRLPTKNSELQTYPSKVSAALLASPDIDWMFAQFSNPIKPMIQGATDAGRPEIPVVATTAVLGDLQQLATGGDSLQATVGYDVTRTSWFGADQLMRLIVGAPGDPADYGQQPLRIFTKDNVTDLDLTPEAWASGDWFAGSGYQETLKALWGK